MEHFLETDWINWGIPPISLWWLGNFTLPRFSVQLTVHLLWLLSRIFGFWRVPFIVLLKLFPMRSRAVFHWMRLIRLWFASVACLRTIKRAIESDLHILLIKQYLINLFKYSDRSPEIFCIEMIQIWILNFRFHFHFIIKRGWNLWTLMLRYHSRFSFRIVWRKQPLHRIHHFSGSL